MNKSFLKVVKLLLGLIIITILFANCSKKESNDLIINNEEIIVSVSILPQKFFVQKIAGDKVTVNTLIPNGASPTLYEPNPMQLKELEKSSIYFKVGHPNFPFEKRCFEELTKNNKNLLSIDMFKGVNYISYADEHHHHSHDKKDNNTKKIHTDSHLWTSPENVKVAAAVILESLSKIDSKNVGFYKKRYDKFIEEINLLQNRIKTLFNNNKSNKKFLVFHPSWGYFANEYNLEQFSVEVDGKTPSAKSLMDVVKKAKENNIKVIFVQEGFSNSSAKVIAKELDADVITISPLRENWLENIEDVARVISGISNM